MIFRIISDYSTRPYSIVILEKTQGFWHKTRTKYDFFLIKHVITDYFANNREKIVLYTLSNYLRFGAKVGQMPKL